MVYKSRVQTRTVGYTRYVELGCSKWTIYASSDRRNHGWPKPTIETLEFKDTECRFAWQRTLEMRPGKGGNTVVRRHRNNQTLRMLRLETPPILLVFRETTSSAFEPCRLYPAERLSWWSATCVDRFSRRSGSKVVGARLSRSVERGIRRC